MLVGSACGTLALQQQGSLASWRAQGQLIESDHFAASFQDAGASLLGDAEGAQLQLWHLQQTHIIGDCTDNDDSFLCLAAGLQETGNLLQRNWWQIGAAHKQTLQNDFVELLVRATVQETVQLQETKEIGYF